MPELPRNFAFENVLKNRCTAENHTLKFHSHTLFKQYHRKVLPSSFHSNVHTLGFHLQTQKLEPQESTAQQLSFKCLHHGISFINSRKNWNHTSGLDLRIRRKQKHFLFKSKLQNV